MMRSRCSIVAGGCAAIVACALLGPANAQQLDVTRLLISRPGIANGIAGLCAHACAGNEARSWLEKATLTIFGAAAPIVLDATIKLESRHVPFRGVVLYDHTASLEKPPIVQGWLQVLLPVVAAAAMTAGWRNWSAKGTVRAS
jgi:hypothetical protein